MQFAGKLWMDVKFLDSSVFKKESKLIFGFPDIPTFHHMKIYCSISYVRKHLIAAYLWSVLLIFTSIYTINRGMCPRPCVAAKPRAVKPPCEPRPAACRGPRGGRLASQGPRLTAGKPRICRGKAAYNLVIYLFMQHLQKVNTNINTQQLKQAVTFKSSSMPSTFTQRLS